MLAGHLDGNGYRGATSASSCPTLKCRRRWCSMPTRQARRLHPVHGPVPTAARPTTTQGWASGRFVIPPQADPAPGHAPLYLNKKPSCASWSPTLPTPATSCASRPGQTPACTRTPGTWRTGARLRRRPRRRPSRQRHRHERRRSRAHLGTIAKSGTREFTRVRAKQRRQADRPVRRRLLGFHRRRPHHRRIARAAGLAAEEGVRWSSEAYRRVRGRDHHVPSAAPTSSCTCARARTSSRPAGSLFDHRHTPTTSPGASRCARDGTTRRRPGVDATNGRR